MSGLETKLERLGHAEKCLTSLSGYTGQRMLNMQLKDKRKRPQRFMETVKEYMQKAGVIKAEVDDLMF